MSAGGHWWRWDTRYLPTPAVRTIQVIEPASAEERREHEDRAGDRVKRARRRPRDRVDVVPFGFARALVEDLDDEATTS